MKRILFGALAACLASSVDAELVIDNFADPAEIVLPDGPDRVTTEGVGDLNATRLLKFRPVGPGVRTARADIGLSVPGEYTADVDDAGLVLFIDAEYTFDPIDLTQGGRNDAFFVDFSFEEGTVTVVSGYELQPPAVRLLALPTGGPLLTRTFSPSPFPRNDAPFALIVPFDEFTDRGGGQVNADLTSVFGFELWLSGAGIFGPWEVRVDSIRVGNASEIPEPCGSILSLVICGCVLAVRTVRPLCTFWSCRKEKS